MRERKELAYGRDDWKVWTNTGSADVGPWELARVVGGTTRDGETVTQGEQPSSTLGTEYIVNGPTTVTANGGYGVYQPIYTEVIFKYDGSAPSAGDNYGPKASQGTAVKDSDPAILKVFGVSDSSNNLAKGLLYKQDAGLLLWGRVQSGFTNESGVAQRAVSVKRCDSDDTDGSTEEGDAFNVSTPIRKNKATALFEGYVVGYVTDVAGDKFILTDCFDDPLDTVKQWDAATADIPQGWSEVTAAQGRFIVGVDGSHALDGTGGNLTHTHDDHTHTQGVTSPALGFGYCIDIQDHSHNTVNHEPPWLGLYNIKRTS